MRYSLGSAKQRVMRPMKNAFKQALAAGQLQIGLWQGLASPYCAEICAGAGFDWLLFDGEHSPTDIPGLLAQLQAVTGTPAHAVARPPFGEARLIKQYLDLGFETLLIPMVNSAEQAAQLVRACRYPPEGIRGVGMSRASRWGRDANYVAEANREVCLLVQIETREALANLDEICRTEGVDGVFIGPADLAASLGHLGRPGHPEVVAAIEAAIASIRAAGKAPGILSADPALADRYIELGCTFVAVGTDMSLLARATEALASRFTRRGSAVESGGSPY